MFNKKMIFYYKWILIPLILGITPVSVIASESSKASRQILQSASEFDYPPFCLVLKDGTADGFSVDLIKAVVKEAGLEINIPVGPWHEIKQKLIDKKIDLLPFVSYSRVRDQFFDFTVPYLKMHGTVFVRKGETSIHSEKDLKNKEIITMRADAAHEYVMEKNLSRKIILTDSFEEALTLLSQGKHDAVVIQQLVGLQLIKKLKITNLVDIDTKMHTSLKPISVPVSEFEQKFCFAVQEGDRELLATLNEALAIVFANGTYDHLYIKWFSPILPHPPVPVTMILKYLLYILGPIFFLSSLAGFLIMRKKVAQKTQHLIQQIQKRERVEEALKDALIINEKIISHSPIGISIYNEFGQCVITNDSFGEIIGAKKEQVMKQNYNEIESWKTSGLLNIAKDAIRNGITRRYEFQATSTFGKEATVDCYLVPFTKDSKIMLMLMMIDIYKQKQTEKSLRDSEARFKKMIEKSPLPMVIADKKQDIWVFNDKFTKSFGYTREDVSTAEEWWETAYPDEKNRAEVQHSWMMTIEKAEAEKTDIEMQEWDLTIKDGSKRSCEFYMVPLVDVSLIIVKDITERKQADDILKEYTHHLGERVKELNCLYSISNFIEADISLEEVFRKTVNLIPPSWQYPEKTSARILFKNQEYTSDVFFESQRKQQCNIIVQGKMSGVVQVFYKESKTDFSENPFVKEEEDLIRAICQRLSDTIERKEAEQNLKMIHENLEDLVKQRTVELETEVTERKQTEEKLRYSQTMLQAVFDGISDPLTMLGKDMIVEMMNTAAAGYYGVGLQHAKGKPCYLGLRKKNVICEGCKVPTGILGGKALTFERNGIMNPDRYERVAVYPIQAETVEAGAIMHITDITESKRLHTQLIRADRLSALGQLSGGIAHEIRNPLAGIRLFVDILCDKNKFDRNDKEEELFDDIKQGIRRIDAIIKRVLNYAKPMEISSGKVDINNIINDTLRLFATKLMDLHIKLKVSLSENIACIDGDTIGIQQVVTNLIINAIDAMSNGGGLNINTFETESSLSCNRPIVTIIIKDTGPGIKAEDRENIFNPFFTTKSTGTGLGLAISHQIIKYHSGNIYLESKPGCGSIFTIELPITKE